MAKNPKISILDVERAAKELKLHSKPVNPYQIRKILGQGSYDLIEEYIKTLNLELSYEEDDPLTKRLVSIIRPVAESLQTEMSTAIDHAKTEFESRKKELNENLESQAGEIISLQESENLLKKTNENLSSEAIKKDQINSSMASKIESLEKDIIKLTLQVENTEEKYISSEKRLEYTRVESKERYENLIKEHNRATEGLQSELINERNDSKDKTASLVSTSSQLASISTEKNAIAKQLRKSEIDIAVLTENLNSTKSTIGKLKEEIQNARENYEAELHDLKLSFAAEKSAIYIEENKTLMSELLESVQILSKKKDSKNKNETD